MVCFKNKTKSKTKQNQQGFAIIVVVVMVAVIMTMVVGVGTLVSISYKNAHDALSRTTALTLAEAGAAYAIYRLNHFNYDNYPGYVGADAKYYPFGPDTDISSWTPTGWPADASFSVDFTDGVPAANADEIKVTGDYKGKTRTVKFLLRGTNAPGVDLDIATHGIAEAFNKHVIYAKEVKTTTGPVATITGNIVRQTIDNIEVTSTIYTVTTIALAEVPTLITAPALPAYVAGDIFQNGRLLPGGAFSLPGGVIYSGSRPGEGDSYTFNSAYGATNVVDVLKANGQYDNNGTFVILGGEDSNGDVILDEAGIPHYLKVAGNITLQDSTPVAAPYITLSADTVLELSGGGSITINSGITIDGDLIVKGAVLPSPLDLDSVTVNGAVVCEGDITFSGVVASTINASSSAKEAAIVSVSDGTGFNIGGNIDIQIAPTIILGTPGIPPIRSSAIIAYGIGTDASSVTVDDHITDASKLCRSLDQATIISSTAGAGVSTVNIDADVSGLVYAGGASGDIYIDGGTTKGILVASGTVTIDAVATAVNYYSNSFEEISNTRVFKNFSGGRRVYLPVADSWKEE